ncbi:MAG: ABC transporter ATP-binding protein [Deltaproteobacteria bacterium]|jgi:branched-chain amino acid transport system ATP-binding protein|nr:ABC transporter ATP-binding protein [Deltaproteobacteria bacterium]
MSEPLLSLSAVHTSYGNIEALHGIDLVVYPGEIVCLIGANGAGKTTTLMSISGCVKTRSGTIRFDGKDITQMPSDRIVRLGLAQSPEGRKIFPRLTVLENLEMGAFIRDDKAGIAADIERVIALFPILGERRHQAGGTLSGGEQQMLAVGRAMMSRPKLLLLDEPSLGLAPLIVLKIFEVIKTLNAEGTTILLVEQNARMALRHSHRGYVLETGAITMADKADVLLADPRVQAAYLGEGDH